MSIRSQLILIIGGLLLFVLGATAGGLYWAERKALLDRMEESRHTQMAQFAQSLRDALVLHDDLAAMNTANSLMKLPEVKEAYGVGPNGVILAHGNPARVGRRAENSDGVRLSKTILIGKQKTDAVIVYSDTYLDRALSQAMTPVAHRIGMVILGALGLGMFAAFLLAKRLIRPIERIAEGTRRIAEGDLSHRLALGRGNELKRLAADFDKMAERLGVVDQMKKDFVSNVTHELRSPLSAIESYLNLVTNNVRAGDSSQTLDHLAIMRNNATRLGRFIDDVLDLSTIEARAVDVRMESLNPKTLMDEIVTLFAAKARERTVGLTVSPIPLGVRVWGDADKMQQVLINLVGNALKFTPAGGAVRLSVTNDSAHTHLHVADTGPGISPEDLRRIFNRFEQAKNGVSVGSKGTGLGLAIAQGLVDAQGGSITVQSVVGKGTVFSVHLNRDSPLGSESGSTAAETDLSRSPRKKGFVKGNSPVKEHP
jgi:signal transduction histidine kinase